MMDEAAALEAVKTYLLDLQARISSTLGAWQCSAGRAPAMGGGDLDKARGAARGTHDAHALE
jgi:hypothetical protein